MCIDHVARRDGSDRICRRCAYSQTLGQVGRTIEKKKVAAAEGLAVAAEGDGPGKPRRLIGAIVLSAVVVGVALVYLPILSGAVSEELPYAEGAISADAPGLADSVQGLWEVRRALDLYLYRNEGRPPASIGALGDTCPQKCPGCGKPWAYQHTEEGEYSVACPSPSSHERGEILISHRVGAPRVRMHAGSDHP